MTTALSVNLNKIALLRNSREGNYPSVIHFAQEAIDAGARGITVHPRPDQRHIRPKDVTELSQLIKQHPTIEFNIEGNPFAAARDDYPGLLALIDHTRPHQATLVPDNNTQLTSDHGFDLISDSEQLRPIINQLKRWNIRISLFMDPDIKQIALAKEIGADRIELYTGPYAANPQDPTIFKAYADAATYAKSIDLGINAGHDLNLANLAKFLTIPNIEEVSIGHALTVEALDKGYKNTVAAYSQICQLA